MTATRKKPVRQVEKSSAKKAKPGVSLPVRVAPILWLLLIAGVLVAAALFSTLAYQGKGVLLSTVTNPFLTEAAVPLS